MKTLIINGSHRNGNTDITIGLVKSELKGMKVIVDELKLRDIEMKIPDGCSTCADGEECPNIKDEFSKEIEPTPKDYDLYILATPTWSDNITPLTNIFWNRIVSWCHEDRMYLKGKKLAVITHGMAGEDSWKNVVGWVKSVCEWEECNFAGSLTFKSGGKVGDVKISKKVIKDFVDKINT